VKLTKGVTSSRFKSVLSIWFD